MGELRPTANEIKFAKLSTEEFHSLNVKDNNVVYFCEDSKEIYVGSTRYVGTGYHYSDENFIFNDFVVLPTLKEGTGAIKSFNFTAGPQGTTNNKLTVYNGNFFRFKDDLPDEETINGITITYDKSRNVIILNGSCTEQTAIRPDFSQTVAGCLCPIGCVFDKGHTLRISFDVTNAPNGDWLMVGPAYYVENSTTPIDTQLKIRVTNPVEDFTFPKGTIGFKTYIQIKPGYTFNNTELVPSYIPEGVELTDITKSESVSYEIDENGQLVDPVSSVISYANKSIYVINPGSAELTCTVKLLDVNSAFQGEAQFNTSEYDSTINGYKITPVGFKHSEIVEHIDAGCPASIKIVSENQSSPLNGVLLNYAYTDQSTSNYNNLIFTGIDAGGNCSAIISPNADNDYFITQFRY